MYAAAGGASLASRQARQRQRQSKTRESLSHQPRQPKEPLGKTIQQFHNYTDGGAPHVAPLLSRVERGIIKPPSTAATTPTSHHRPHHHRRHHHRRHSSTGQQQHFHHHHHHHHHRRKAAVSRIRASPSISIPVAHHLFEEEADADEDDEAGPERRGLLPPPLPPTAVTVDDLLMLPQITAATTMVDGFTASDKQRRCSFVRQWEESEQKTRLGLDAFGLLDRCQHICNFELKADLPLMKNSTADEHLPPPFYFGDRGGGAGGGGDGTHDLYHSWEYPLSECSQGRAAWQDRERAAKSGGDRPERGSRSDGADVYRQKYGEHRWMKRNRIRDTTTSQLDTGSESGVIYGGAAAARKLTYDQNGPANILLYVGLGTTVIGSVIFFVGTGEKGFKTLELRLIGPVLIVCGLLCCVIRVMLCVCPTPAWWRRRRHNKLPPTKNGPQIVEASQLRHAHHHHHHRHKRRKLPPPTQRHQHDKMMPQAPEIRLASPSSVVVDIGPDGNRDPDLDLDHDLDPELDHDLEVSNEGDNVQERDAPPKTRNLLSNTSAAHSGIVLSPLQLGQ